MTVKDGGKFGKNFNFETSPFSAHSQQAAELLFFAEDRLGIFFKNAREYECLFFFHCVSPCRFSLLSAEKRGNFLSAEVFLMCDSHIFLLNHRVSECRRYLCMTEEHLNLFNRHSLVNCPCRHCTAKSVRMHFQNLISLSDIPYQRFDCINTESFEA